VACLASGQFWASTGSLGKGDEGTVIEILEIKDQKQIIIWKRSLNHLDKVWARTSDTISWHPSDDQRGCLPTSCSRRNKNWTLKAHKAKAALSLGLPRSTIQSSHVRTTKRVSRRSFMYNSSLASKQLHYRNSPKTQTYPYEALFTNMTNQSSAEVVAL
jgi:hypothetical protein